ncbi:hypothetical protein PAAL109150_26355 [Paenibacillus alkaliterrae]
MHNEEEGAEWRRSAAEWKIILQIMVPMVKPVLVTFALFSFIAHWNDYFWPLVMTTNENFSSRRDKLLKHSCITA